MFAEWCTVLSLNDEKVHLVNARNLETEYGDSVTDADLCAGKELIWIYKSVPYTVQVQEVHGKYIIIHFLVKLTLHQYS